MFTAEQRESVRSRLLELVQADPRVTGGALTGSAAGGPVDRWSDIDIAFGVAEGNDLRDVLDDWMEAIDREFGVLHYWDLPSGPSIYRVLLLPSGLEIDIGLSPAREFRARGPRFKHLFGEAAEPLLPSQAPAASTDVPVRFAIGLGWHHIFHARSSIERGKGWRAEYWISGLRDETLSLICRRLGEEPSEARGIDRLPESVTTPFVDTLVRSLDKAELNRALAAGTARFINEVEAWNPALCASLKPLLEEFGSPQAAD